MEAGTASDLRTGPRWEFDAASAVEPTGPGRWRVGIADGWDIGGKPNGGYLLAVVVRALVAGTARPDPLAVTAHYLAPAAPGPATVDVTVVRLGRRHTTATASLRQAGGEVARVLATLADLSASRGAPARTWGGGPPPLPPPERCPRLLPAPPSPLPPPLADRVELRVPAEQLGFAVGAPSGEAVVSGWARFPDGRPPDAVSLPLFADAFPPAVFEGGLPLGWMPTVELSVQVRKRPAPGWLRGVFRTRFLTGEHLEEDGELYDSVGDLVALSRQLALAPRPAEG